MKKKPPILTIGFNVPFNEAIAAAKRRGVVLPDIYYGELQGIARQLAFSIAGVASLDQLQAVKDSLHAAMDKGVSFKDWKKTLTAQSLGLPDHRLDNIWRTNLQGNYMRGKWEQFASNAERRPFLMYDAINDSRVRPSHLAMDGTIRRIDDPFWKTHSPPNGYRCRCSLISLTEDQAHQRSGDGNGLNKVPVDKSGRPAMPDDGWESNPFDDRLDGIKKSLDRLDPIFKEVAESKKLPDGIDKPDTISEQQFERLSNYITEADGFKTAHKGGLPTSLSNWGQLSDERYIAFLENISSTDNMVKSSLNADVLDDVRKIVDDDRFLLKDDVRLFSGLSNDAVKAIMQKSEKGRLKFYTSRYMALNGERVFNYAGGENPAILDITIKASSRMVGAKVFDLHEAVLLPGAEARIDLITTEIVNGMEVTRYSITIIDDGTDHVKNVLQISDAIDKRLAGN